MEDLELEEEKQESQESKDFVVSGKVTPKNVLWRKMLFYDEKAEELLKEIIICLKKSNPPRTELIALMAKKMFECNEMAIDCATKLAPYIHSKLQNIEVNKTVTKQFVIRAPMVAPNSQQWLDNVGEVKTPQLQIDVIKNNKDSYFGHEDENSESEDEDNDNEEDNGYNY